MLVTGIPSRAGSEIVVWAWEKLLSIRWVTRGRQRGAQALQGRLRRVQVDQDAVVVANLEPAVERAHIESLDLLPPDKTHRVAAQVIVHARGVDDQGRPGAGEIAPQIHQTQRQADDARDHEAYSQGKKNGL